MRLTITYERLSDVHARFYPARGRLVLDEDAGRWTPTRWCSPTSPRRWPAGGHDTPAGPGTCRWRGDERRASVPDPTRRGAARGWPGAAGRGAYNAHQFEVLVGRSAPADWTRCSPTRWPRWRCCTPWWTGGRRPAGRRSAPRWRRTPAGRRRWPRLRPGRQRGGRRAAVVGGRTGRGRADGAAEWGAVELMARSVGGAR